MSIYSVTAQANADACMQVFPPIGTDSCNYADIADGFLDCSMMLDSGNGGVRTVRDQNGPFPVLTLQYIVQLDQVTMWVVADLSLFS